MRYVRMQAAQIKRLTQRHHQNLMQIVAELQNERALMKQLKETIKQHEDDVQKQQDETKAQHDKATTYKLVMGTFAIQYNM